MAIREVRFYIYTGDTEKDNILAKEVYQPFTWYMDTLMRGRFKEYSGEEMKGINLVNLCLYTKNKIRDMGKRSGSNLRLNEWIPMLNTLQLESEIDLDEFIGTQAEKVYRAIEIFISFASKSDLPQMKKLVEHLIDSLGKQSIEEAIKKANEYLDKLLTK